MTDSTDEKWLALADDIDRRGGSRAVKAKQYSIDHLRNKGLGDDEIGILLNVKL